MSYSHLVELFGEHLLKYQKTLDNSSPQELYAPENYILSLGGKRVRPLLALIACDLFNEDPSKALDAALCVELFHNFSLIHDDILDEAPLRRNHPTVHKKWNSSIAILSGDVMLVKAFSVLNSYSVNQHHSLSALFTKTAIEVCEGQQYDMNFETTEKVSVDEYIHMITNKTAVLLGCSLQMGAIAATADVEAQKHLYEFGKHLGIAFQLMDDLLDVYADTKSFGKQEAGDILANKKTFLYLKAFELATQKQNEALKSFFKMDKSNAEQKITGVKTIYDELQVARLCTHEATLHTNCALDHLNHLNVDATKKENLKQFALSLLNRSS